MYFLFSNFLYVKNLLFQEESEEWACQAQTYRNEVESVKAEMQSELESKEKQIQILQKTLQVRDFNSVKFYTPIFLCFRACSYSCWRLKRKVVIFQVF